MIETLSLPELYPPSMCLLEVHRLESGELIDKTAVLCGLVDRYAVE